MAQARARVNGKPRGASEGGQWQRGPRAAGGREAGPGRGLVPHVHPKPPGCGPRTPFLPGLDQQLQVGRKSGACRGGLPETGRRRPGERSAGSGHRACPEPQRQRRLRWLRPVGSRVRGSCQAWGSPGTRDAPRARPPLLPPEPQTTEEPCHAPCGAGADTAHALPEDGTFPEGSDPLLLIHQDAGRTRPSSSDPSVRPSGDRGHPPRTPTATWMLGETRQSQDKPCVTPLTRGPGATDRDRKEDGVAGGTGVLSHGDTVWED